MRCVLRVGLLASALAFTCMALAQAPEPSLNPRAAGKLADPTSVQGVVGPDKTVATGAAPAPRVSPLALRGRIIGRDKPPAALLEVEGKLYTVTKGSQVPGSGNTMLNILEVNADELRLEVAPQKEIVILR